MMQTQANLYRLAAAIVLAAAALAGCDQPKSNLSYSPPEEDSFQRGVDRAPTAKTLYAMAGIFIRQGRDNEAMIVLNRVVADYPQCMSAYCDLAELHLRNGRPDAAISVLCKGLQVAPRDTVLLNDLGMCWLLKQDYELAMVSFARAVEYSPLHARYRSNLAMALGMMGRYDEALALFEQVVPLADAHYNLSILCDARRDKPRAALERDRSLVLRQEPAADLLPSLR